MHTMTHDFIVIGAGSAGCVITRRLLDAGARVLLLEAGGPDLDPRIKIPAAFSQLFRTPYDWELYTQPQRHLLGRTLYWPRGKTLGGSGAINAMIVIRGHLEDYQSWGTDWSWDQVLPYFQRIEHHFLKNEHHGQDGPMEVQERNFTHPITQAFLRAAVQMGHPVCRDFNTGKPYGFGLYHVNHRKGERHSPFHAYLKGHKGYTLKTRAQVLRILLHNKAARGVVYRHQGKVLNAFASQGVILTAGAIHSPHLLMHSGIGDPAVLRHAGIDLEHALPGVGQNLQDHPAVPLIYQSRTDDTLETALQPQHILNYTLKKQGPLSSNVAEAGGFIRSKSDLSAPDLQFHMAPVYYRDHGLTAPPMPAFSLGPTLLTPRSTGRLWVQDANPLKAPLIDPHYLHDPEDLYTLIRGLEMAHDLIHQPALKPYRGKELLPGHKDLQFHVQSNLQTLYHPAGTCQMGEHPQAVVDSRLRVHGLKKLYVADASVMPALPRGNTQFPTMMIAERAAEWILQDQTQATT
ncbi:GMC family oxidoreductase [Deinococcus cellulosilyticus]|uniref:GMC oxidoreductase n=1 Tax=Deinococcus cellulosilyticus (strain DSM 18568 / NBRC 106333 / KACC 11606 / 5516J-15) TaxID=1223518 RepID=A0A511N8E7_DEIC1|nr:GMC family oxidoreductase N-terminal domain-containing protein [Deinococcus cellulosilyticus]GEM48748.1 GMC oxidoreductase [Deinococcus cellulosilyticus NBRC 106333 = KACC 11606]